MDIDDARPNGMEIPFSPHDPDHRVDLDAIPLGGKVAAQLALELLSL